MDCKNLWRFVLFILLKIVTQRLVLIARMQRI